MVMEMYYVWTYAVHQLELHSSAVDVIVMDQPHSSGQHLPPIVSLFS